ncbi:tRNA 2-selenouridine(34) synthase MnmH [Pseudomonas sp. RIT-PI-S]|uniref:tRNA 2-selenouridine(34) synthase MnmH n=1 Tax=Pseudomonas sp. RIT-PI-S TaxID=3035295 RepID=UPI0021DA06CB|nr:tRNA 2-selenouridine(34) synthase MnmH [Pseudomonas sp. RIT-PI-S]
MAENTTAFERLFLEGVPMMDVRAPVEFGKGAFPGVTNLPLMDDRERERVGTAYKHHGQQAAIDLGHTLVAGALKQARIEAWAAFAKAHPEGYLYCFRGGLRSQITQQWLKAEAGIDYPRVVGGYKALRTFLIERTEASVATCDFVCLGGMTGIGKTEVLAELSNAVDLEALANHRGSGFGKRATPQPAPIAFENALAIDLLKRRAQGQAAFVVEDESRMIGSCALPLSLFRRMQRSPLVWLEDSLESRVARILGDYVVGLCAEFVALQGEGPGFEAFAARLRQSLAGIAKRLGGERYQRLATIMDDALRVQQASGAVEGHRGWIEGLLKEYYDPMYAYQRDAKGERIEFSGERAAVIEYLRQRRPASPIGPGEAREP